LVAHLRPLPKTLSGTLPARDLDHNSAQSLPEEKRDLTLREAVLLTLQRNPELAAFAKEMRALKEQPFKPACYQILSYP
jgi:outer membrane protein TolC